MPRRPRLLAVLISTFLLAGVVPGPVPAAESGTAVLRWRNGDELRGKVLPGPAGRLTFAAPEFTAPFELDPAQLASLRFEAAAPSDVASDTGATFEVFLKNGDRLQGSLLAVEGGHFHFRCDQLKDPVAIRTAEVLRVSRLSRLQGTPGGISGLGNLDEWSSYGRDRKPTDWQADLRGEFVTQQWLGNLFRGINLPERVEVAFRTRFPRGHPHLDMGLLREPRSGPMLETWDDQLVLTHGNRFAPVMEVSEGTRELDLRLFWDQTAGKAMLCDASGRVLARIEGETGRQNPDSERQASDPHRRGFSILSRSPEMRLVSLEIREWDGGPVPVIDPDRPRVVWRDGSVDFPATVLLKPGSGRIQLDEDTFDLDALSDWILAPEATSPPAPESDPGTRIAWHSGTSLSGEFLSLGPEEFSLKTPWSDQPVPALLKSAREVRFPEGTGILESGTDLLTLGELRLRGSTRLVEGGTGLLAWRPPGATAAVTFAEDAAFTILRNRDLPEPTPVLGLARLYLKTDEVLTGELLGISQEKVNFRSRVTGDLEIAADQVRAIDTGTSGRILEGFRDPEWEVVTEAEGGVELEADRAVLRSGAFGNPSILLGDLVRFDTEWTDAYGAMTLRFFTAGPEPGHASTDVVVATQGNRLFLGKLNESGAFSFSGDQIPIANNRASLEISARPEEIEIRVNGKSSLKVKVEPSQVSGNGLYFKMGGGWQGWNQAESAITLRRFRVESSPGSLPRRVIDPVAKARSLAIPRSNRENPPTHLLVAPNGDLLRGRLLSCDATTVRFHHNGVDLDLPRVRVSSIVGLAPPQPASSEEAGAEASRSGPTGVARAGSPSAAVAAAPAKADPEDAGEDSSETGARASSAVPSEERRRELAAYGALVSHSIVLRDGSRLRLEGRGIEDNRLSGLSPALGKCLVSLDQVREVVRTPARPLENLPPLGPPAFADWRAVLTPDPAIPRGDAEAESPLIGEDAPEFEIGTLGEEPFRLADHRGKVVVLDFWASWCGPCVKAMPEVTAAVAAFPEEAVVLCAVNQGETPPLVSDFLSARGWQTPVALDFNLKVSAAYRVEAIPHTVVIDPEGRVAWVHTGFSPDLKARLFEVISQLLSR